METINQKQFAELIKAHKRWLANNKEKNSKLSLAWKKISNDNSKILSVKNEDLSKSFFWECKFEDVHFCHVCFDGTVFAYCSFRRCKFEDCSLAHVDLMGSRIISTPFTDCELSCASFLAAALKHSRFVGCRGKHLFFYDSLLTQITFIKCRFEDVKPQGNTACGEVVGLPVYQCVRGFGSRQGTLTVYARGKRENWRWFAGCFEGTEPELRAAIEKKHKTTNKAKAYYRAIDYLIDTALMDKKTKKQPITK